MRCCPPDGEQQVGAYGDYTPASNQEESDIELYMYMEEKSDESSGEFDSEGKESKSVILLSSLIQLPINQE